GEVVSSVDRAPQYRDVAYGYFGSALGHLSAPTPGGENAPLGPEIASVEHRWTEAATLLVSADIQSRYAPVTRVMLHYRAMFGEVVEVAMVDDGTLGDLVANDGIYAAQVPAGLAGAGEMIRYYVTADSEQELSQRAPFFADPLNSPEYFGTIIPDPTLQSDVPILHRFVENTRLMDLSRGTRAAVFFDGEFYDNVFIRIRGGTARDWPKKSYKIEFNDDHLFVMRPDLPRVDEIDVNATYTDKSYLRARLTSDFQDRVGTPSPITQHIQMRQNGQYYSLALMVEQPDQDFLIRNGLDPEGSLYKANPGATYLRSSVSAFEKKTRDDEDRSDVTALLTGLQLKGEELERFLFDNINLPAQINFIATNVITQNIDATDKNHFLYRDTNGTGEWQMLPWDLDLTFGPDALNTDVILADQNTRGASNPTAVHPFLGAVATPLHVGKINMLIDGIVTTPRTREMLLRRIRTLADEYLGADYFEQQIDEMVALIKDEVPLDRAAWGTRAHFGGRALDYQDVAQLIKDQYLARRLPYLTEYHVTGGVGIPTEQPLEATLLIDADIQFNPASGNPGDEYFTLHNPNAYSVDVSGWKISGATESTLAAGTVIGAGERLYLTRNVAAFRARTTGPGGGQSLFVQGYATNLSDVGGELTVTNRAGQIVATARYGNSIVPADASNLRISEIMYVPRDGNVSLGELPGSGESYEFVELTNISDDVIELGGVQFTDGVSFHFDAQQLGPRQSVLVVGNRAAFNSRYGDEILLALGQDEAGNVTNEFTGKLANSGDTLRVLDQAGSLIQEIAYGVAAPWPTRASAGGSSLVWRDGSAAFDATDWRASATLDGTPGSSEAVSPTNVVINELRVRGVDGAEDQVELYNSTWQTIDLGGWYLTDDLADLPRYQLPAGTRILPHNYLVISEGELGSGLSASNGDRLWLLRPDEQGRPQHIADFVEFGPVDGNATIGRWPDGVGAVVVLASDTIGGRNTGVVVRGTGDFNNDQRIDAIDLDLICAAIRQDDNSPSFDLNGDNDVTQDDLNVMVHDLMKTSFGDANLDGVFDSQDLVALMQAGTYEQDVDAVWSTGDWDCDGRFTTRDLVLAYQGLV
ncbi:MAG: CotH kinase family protein, partial [Planctomycetales bacterium]|nr:CotH kinase family protein [Planctomycetales bacterium]